MAGQLNNKTQRIDWNHLVRQIKRIVTVSQVIRDFSAMELKRQGRQYFCVCPFHADTDPSFVVNDEKHRGRCYGCGWTGDQVDFVRSVLSLPFKEAVEVLCRRYGLPFAGMTTQEYLKAKARAEVEKQDREMERAFNSKVERVYFNLADMFRAIDRNFSTYQSYQDYGGLTHIADILEDVLDELISSDTKRQLQALRYAKEWWGAV